MPGNLMHYSGLVTKTRALSGNLLKKEELQRMMELTTVNEAILFLKNTKGYRSIFTGQENIWHRGQAEAVILNPLYQDFERLYRFADAGQKPAFHFVLLRYETDILKRCFKSLFQENDREWELYIDPFFYKHAEFPMEQIRHASGLTEFIHALENTPFEHIFRDIQEPSKNVYADYASRVDLFYYSGVYREIRRMKRSSLKTILLDIYGTQIDWLNIMWIYRAKRFYQLTEAELTALTIPFTYRIRKEELKRLIGAPDLDSMNRILEKTGYFKGKDAFLRMENEISYREILNSMYDRVSRKYPMSIAPVMKYLYEKEQEIRSLTTIIEGIRYQVPPEEIQDLVLMTV